MTMKARATPAKSTASATLTFMTAATPARPKRGALIDRLHAIAAAPWMVRVRELASHARDLFPWTALGLGLGLGSYAALRAFAYAQLDLVWLVTGYAAVGLCALCPVFVIVGAVVLRVQTRVPNAEDTLVLETVTPAATGFSLLSLRFLPLTQVRWQWLTPHEVEVTTHTEGGRAHELVSFADRGLHSSIERRVMIEDPFGLARIAFRLRQ